jgi:hypothetical protein
LAAAPSPEPTGSVTPSAAARAAHASAKKNDKKDDGQGEPKEEWWKAGGITREKINAMCWMKYEKGRADLPIDKRADLVNACVAQALKEHPLN